MEPLHSSYFDLLTFSPENMTFTLKIMYGPLLRNYKWQLLHISGHINLPWDLCTAGLLWPFDFWPWPYDCYLENVVWPIARKLNDNCFIFAGQINLAWDLFTLEPFWLYRLCPWNYCLWLWNLVCKLLFSPTEECRTDTAVDNCHPHINTIMCLVSMRKVTSQWIFIMMSQWAFVRLNFSWWEFDQFKTVH